MSDLNLTDLQNPRGVIAILVSSRRGLGEPLYIERDPVDQCFQERKGSYELWQMVEGRLMRVQRWLRKSVIADYTVKTQLTSKGAQTNEKSN